ncbi:FlgO family outer membrane protein [Desulfolutivibrio sulfoxidireducens]|uniref:FlgO family outer membrane protein n=1 Tax=Desulfolutivibrio sulfoxidireducens TaxID=2773299 RepID=UPI00159E8F12|nr:FlgO family outer membrane protein [Desulfolutivibrio sulfoxidireducens]QLA20710.1 tetratricopeptide repeat protein [Desulfolutivibrio sulfoxidireducens]
MPRGFFHVLLVAACLLACASVRPVQAAETAAPGRMRIAVLEFEPATPEARTSEKGRLVSEMLTTAAVNSRWFAVVERRIVSRLLEEMEFGERGLSYTSAALKVGALTGAAAILSGSVAESGGRTRIDARCIDVESGRILWAKVVTSGSGLDSVAAASQRLMRELEGFVAQHPRENARTAEGAAPSVPLTAPVLAEAADATPPTPPTPEKAAVGQTAPLTPPAPAEAAEGAAHPPGETSPGVDPRAARTAQAHYQRAREHGRAKRYAKAVREMDQALALDQTRAEYHAARGHARYFQGNPRQALEDYDQALALDASQAAIHSMRGLCLTSLGRTEEAVAAYDRAVELDPDNAELFVRRGRLMRTQGLADRMCADFASACRLGKCECLDRAKKEDLCPATP